MLPVLFEIGPLTVHSWGVLLMLGFLLATWVAARYAPRHGLRGEDVWDVGLWGLLGGVIGARIAYVLLNARYFADQPAEILRVWDGGMTFYGGLIGGILAGALVCRLRRIDVASMADVAALGFPLGYALGRVGCFLNGCCYGGECALPWAVQFQAGHDHALTPPSHPTQIYGTLISLAIFGILLFLERRQQFRGQLMVAYTFLYGFYRFFLEFFRRDVTATVTGIAGLTQGQLASLLLMLVAAVVYVAALRRAKSVVSGTATRSSVT